MRKLKTAPKLVAKPDDVVCVTRGEVIPVEALQAELKEAQKLHEFTQKAFGGWTSIPLRSVGGMTGVDASASHGVHLSSDPTIFGDTFVLDQACPEMRALMERIAHRENGHLLKARLMRLAAHRSIGTHVDHFRGEDRERVTRYHVPIVTHPKVQFYVNDVAHAMLEGEIYTIDVTQPHAVHNRSPIDRVHLVFDVVVAGE